MLEVGLDRDRRLRPSPGATAVVLFALALLAFAVAPRAASALSLERIGDFDEPVFVASDPGDADRLYVVEKQGTITLSDHGRNRPFLDISGSVAGEGERGLLSMAFDPDYATNRRFYVYYVGRADGDLRIAEFTAAADGNSAPVSSRRMLLVVPHPTYPNHNGGQVQIGPDGYLYIGTGDGGGGGDPDENAENANSLLGKILRIDPDPGPGGAPYTVPADNPFVGTAGADEVWSYGLRNPYRFSFDSLTGDLVIGDVGQNAWEEIDYQRRSAGAGRGVNFGWDVCEGSHLYEGFIAGVPDPTPAQEAAFCDAGGRTGPVFDYRHSGSPGGCSVTGGYVSRDPGLPGYAGRYLYADFCAGELRSMRLGDGSAGSATGERSEQLDVASPSSFGQDACGRMYVTSLDGPVYRIDGAEPTDCPGIEPPPELPDNGPCAPSDQLGDDGADQLRGGKGRDALTGKGGRDALRGRGGKDCLAGGRGADELRGGPGGDRLFAGPGRDEVRGGRGWDKVFAIDGTRDRINCGPGKDEVRADPKDRISKNCEKVALASP